MHVMDITKKYENPKVPNRSCFIVSSGDLYPTMISEILEIIQNGEESAKQHLRGMRLAHTAIFFQYMPRALRVHNVGWEAALQAPTEDMTDYVKEQRREALTVARLWFTELLHNEIHHQPMHLRITKVEGNPYRPE